MVRKIIIVVENLKMGGVQRIALDEAYGFASKEISVTLISLEDFSVDLSDSFLNGEKDLISQYNLIIKSSSGKRLDQLLYFRSLLKSFDWSTHIISHSLRGTVLIWFAKFSCRKNLRVHTVIHQLPSLSAPVQRFKRFIYALFSNDLYAFSLAAKSDWEHKIRSSILLRFFFRKKPITLLRNGVFLKRLPVKSDESSAHRSSNIRLIFLGRPVKWKGVIKVLELLGTERLISATAMFYFPYDNQQLFSDVSTQIRDRTTMVFGKTIRDYSPQIGDVHLYPVDYGNGGAFVESISLNCLEMLALGVPSCVTKDGLGTWPELSNHVLISEVDWSDLDKTAEKIFESHAVRCSDTELMSARAIASIDGHIEQLIKILNDK